MTSGSWHGTKKCAVSGAKIPKANQIVGRACPWCGNSLGAEMGSRPPASKPVSTNAERLANLKQLHDDGLITDAEYEGRRSRLIDEAIEAPGSKPRATTPGSIPPPRKQLAPLEIQDASTNRRKTWLIIGGIVVALILVGSVLGGAGSDGGSNPSPRPSASSFSGRVVDYFAENPASLAVVIEMTNRGTAAGNWECTVSASDSSGAYHGFDILSSLEPLSAGETKQYNGSIVITNEGAIYVTEVEMRDCGPE